MNVAIITGGSRGLGLALTHELAHAGWHVITDARDGDALRASVAPVADRVLAVAGDVTDATHRRRLVAAAEELGRLDLLVNNAGSLGPAPLPKLRALPPASLPPLFATNVIGPLGLIQEALPVLVASRGAVINITSDAAVEAYEGWGAYGMTKAALEQLSNVLAVEEPDLRVWWVDPGDMRTRMHQDAFPGEDISDRPDPAVIAPVIVDLVSARPPSGRVRAADVAAASPAGAR